jgi:hypothetical protein
MFLKFSRTLCFSALLFIVTEITTSAVFGLTITGDFHPDTLTNKVYDAEIHTVMLYTAGWELAMPVIELGSSQQLNLRFDDLSKERRNFGYTVLLCDREWKISTLSPLEYLSGFENGTIRESATSFNTTFDYMHHSLLFPEEDNRLLMSGNYALVVYDAENPDKIILTRRFYVTERAVQIEAKIKQPAYGIEKETGQQVEVVVLNNELEIRDPLNEVMVVIKQNGRDDQVIVMNKPYSIFPGRLEYVDPDQGIFQGGNEFRSLDIKSMKYQTENMAAIDFQNPYFHIIMKPDEDCGGKPYFNKTDLNGGFFIDREKSIDKHTDADYIFVHFNLAIPPVYAWDDIYVTGAFCDWNKQEVNKMKYNNTTNRFELTLLLKQGLYDYCFASVDRETKQINEYALEGSFYETENDYTVFVYFHDGNLNHDRIVGYLPIK